MLPFANTQGGITSPLIAFFTAASAVSTTGLTLVPTDTYWTLFGQMVICGLIFLGGLGLVTVVMFNLWIIGNHFSLQDRFITREAMAVQNLGGLVQTLRNIVLLDFAISIIGGLLLFVQFRHYYDLPMSLWQGLFHSVSALHTAGFDIIGPASLVPLRTDFILLTVLLVEGILGSISFSVILEIPAVRRWRRFSLNTKLVLTMTLIISILVFVAVFMNEAFLGTTLTEFSTGGKVFTSLFNGLSASTTTGFSTIDFSQVTIQALLVIIGIMFIGGATGSTAGGIKVNTFAVIIANLWSTLRGKENTEIFGREIDASQIWRALTVALVGLIIVILSLMLIMISSPGIPFERVLFETTSAFGTVGLSTGAITEFSAQGQIVLIFLMFIGRVTPLSVIMILVKYKKINLIRYPKEIIGIG
jgi:trk system potassium uptake protein TrkH